MKYLSVKVGSTVLSAVHSPFNTLLSPTGQAVMAKHLVSSSAATAL